MKNVLVTGGCGFIGSNFIRWLMQNETNVNIVNLDLLTYAGNRENLTDIENSNRYHFVHGDICNRNLVNQIFQDFQIDTVVHFAAESHVDRSILGPEQFIQTNIVGTTVLLDVARGNWEKVDGQYLEQYRFHHVSTDEVYGTLSPTAPPFSEQTPYAPTSPYSASKASSDHLVRAYYHTYGLPITITNCTNNYGPYQFPEKLIPVIILNAYKGNPLPIYGDGMQIRDWLFVEDHCEAIFAVLSRGKVGETYAIGGNNQPTNIEIVRTICQILDEILDNSENKPHSNLITYVKDRPGHDRRYAMDISKISNELDWQPKRNLKEGLGFTVRWYLEHSGWVNSVLTKGDYHTWVDSNYSNRGDAN